MTTNEELPDVIIFECGECDDFTEHEILKGRFGKASVSGTFKCSECGTISSTTIRLPEEIAVKVLYSDGDETVVTETVLMSNDIVELEDDFHLENGQRVRVTKIETGFGKSVRSAQATDIESLWVKQFGIVQVKFSVNDRYRTVSAYVEAEPEDIFAVGMTVPFEDFDCYVHAIKTKRHLLRHGSAEAGNITRVYGKIRKKEYTIMDFDDE